MFMLWNWTIFIALTFLCGGVAGAIAVSFLQIMKLALYILWIKIPQTYFLVPILGTEVNLYYPLLGIIGGILIGIWTKKYGEYPMFLEDVIKLYKRDKNIPYRNWKAVFVASLLPIIFGGSVGLFAGYAGLIMMLLCWGRDKYKSGLAYILEHQNDARRTRLVRLIRNPIATFIGTDITCGNLTHRVSGKEKWTARVSAAVGGIISFRFVGLLFAQKGLQIAVFDKFKYTTNELFSFVPLVLLGLAAGIVFQYADIISAILYKPLQEKKILRAVTTGILIGFAGIYLPYSLFSGQEQMVALVKHWEEWTVPMLFATGIAKIFLTNFCIHGGWRGGSFFPCIFCATIIGYGLSTFTPAAETFVILTFMASFVTRALGHPLIVIISCMLFAPLQAIFPIIGASLCSAWFYNIHNGRPGPQILKRIHISAA